MTPPRSPCGPAPRVFEGVLLQWHDSRTQADHMIIRGEGGHVGTDLDDVVKGLDGKRVRITVEVLAEPPTDGRTSSEANYDPMTAPVPEGDMNGPHGEIPPSSEGGQR